MTLKCVQQQPSSNRITYRFPLCEVIGLRWERFVSIRVMRGNDGVTIGGNSIFIQLPFTGFLESASVVLNRKPVENHLSSCDGKSSAANFKHQGQVCFGNGLGNSTGVPKHCGRCADETWSAFKAKETEFSQEEAAVFWKSLDVYWEEGLGSETSLEKLGKLCSYFPHFPVGRLLLRSGLKHD